MLALIKQLKGKIEGEIRSDTVSRRVYSVDASIYEVEPLCVTLPKHAEDVHAIVKTAKEHGVPVIPRGAGTGITGGCLGRGIIIDFSKFMTSILDIDQTKETVVCEPGVVQDDLNNALAKVGCRLGPDTSTGNRATLGGMLANNAAGARSLKFGKMVDHVLAVDAVLADGNTMRLEELDKAQLERKLSLEGHEGNIYRSIDKIKTTYRKDIENGFPPIPRRVSGYNLDELIKSQNMNLSKLFAGSEGTLGIATQITMRIVPKLKSTGLCLLQFHDVLEGMRAIETILAHRPIAVEMIDRNILEMAKLSPDMRNKVEWVQGDPASIFAVEFEADSENALKDLLHSFAKNMSKMGIGYTQTCLSDRSTIAHVWDVRKKGLTLLLSKRSYQRASAFIEDISVAPEKLSTFMPWFLNYLKSLNKDAGIYGHAGSGCMHIRPYVDMRKKEELALMEKIMKDVTAKLLEVGGTLSGEHGDGLVRSWLNRTLFGDRLYQAFVDVKTAFDPENRMNPGKIVHPEPFLKDLRLSPETKIQHIETFLDFSKEGGFALAADLCNGNGLCRKTEQTMCPSFQATRDEFHTTRARAQALRGIINGNMPLEAFTSQGLHDVLDLCIECKGCKKECPSQVDMAKMKSEFLYRYHGKHGIPLRDRLFAFVGKINGSASLTPGLFNAIGSTPFAKWLLSLLGVAPERPLPSLATERFSSTYKADTRAGGKPVVLFSDTFTEFHSPEVGHAAASILQALGYNVIVPRWQCCGRTLLSKGFLKQARQYAEAVVAMLESYTARNIPIIGLEPSCLLTIKDDYPGLLGYKNEKLARMMPLCLTFDAFLAQHLTNGRLPLSLDPAPVKLLYHGHCHQKALTGTTDALQVLKALPNASANEIPSGCCGMAGSFGYEKEHYAVSLKIANLKLVPAIKETDSNTLVIADGFSCRHQIAHTTGRKALHLAEAIRRSLVS